MGSVTSIDTMFYNSGLERPDVLYWDTSSLQSANGTFYNMSNLAWLDVHLWDIGSVTDLGNFVRNVTLPSDNYDEILNGFGGQTVNSNVVAHFGSSKFSTAGAVGKEELVDKNSWTIYDGGAL